MVNIAFLTVMVALRLTCGDAKKQASEYFPICHKSDPNFSDCVKHVLEVIRPTLIKGIPELNVVPLEPLVIPHLEYQQGSGNFVFKQTVNNLKIYGLQNYVVRDVKIDFDKLKMDLDLFTPHMRFEFDYVMDGKILLLPIRGNGNGTMNFTDVSTVAHVDIHKVKREGEEFFEVQKIKWDIDLKNCSVHFNNLFNGDKTLGKAMNDFLNENWREAFKTYKYIPEESLGEVIKDISNHVFKTYPHKELFPE